MKRKYYILCRASLSERWRKNTVHGRPSRVQHWKQGEPPPPSTRTPPPLLLALYAGSAYAPEREQPPGRGGIPPGRGSSPPGRGSSPPDRENPTRRGKQSRARTMRHRPISSRGVDSPRHRRIEKTFCAARAYTTRNNTLEKYKNIFGSTYLLPRYSTFS